MSALETWTKRLDDAAISETDRRAIVASESMRAMIFELLEAHRGDSTERAFEDHDALHAWGRLGRVLADAEASPTLAAGFVDALIDSGADWFEPWAAWSRSALVEAFVAAQREIADERVADSWRFPNCVVRLDETTAAVAASYPNDDPDALSRWADEIAAGLAKMGIRRVHAGGIAAARAALESALSVAGIEFRARSIRPK